MRNFLFVGVMDSFIRWHWTSKITILFGILILIFFFISDFYTSANNSVFRTADKYFAVDQSLAASSDHRLDILSMRTIPPIEHFSVMIQRPLFSPHRRVNMRDVTSKDNVALDSPPFPLVKFVGTIEINNDIQALMHGPSGPMFFSTGDEFDGWRILSVERRRIVLGLDNERLDLEILGQYR